MSVVLDVHGAHDLHHVCRPRCLSSTMSVVHDVHGAHDGHVVHVILYVREVRVHVDLHEHVYVRMYVYVVHGVHDGHVVHVVC